MCITYHNKHHNDNMFIIKEVGGVIINKQTDYNLLTVCCSS